MVRNLRKRREKGQRWRWRFYVGYGGECGGGWLHMGVSQLMVAPEMFEVAPEEYLVSGDVPERHSGNIWVASGKALAAADSGGRATTATAARLRLGGALDRGW
ncbi:uncharacterized protein HKW66_Vig0228950 [Vigna angularis]|uniref:Uncharacterized protein n=1 Tax=Phaseolus angularis TaxID=3914 RepID=A0A8T0KA23_PHAAN|nr:uncharacterized protein HKW66_Vig0228950 [Vigna angularis]